MWASRGGGGGDDGGGQGVGNQLAGGGGGVDVGEDDQAGVAGVGELGEGDGARPGTQEGWTRSASQPVTLAGAGGVEHCGHTPWSRWVHMEEVHCGQARGMRQLVQRRTAALRWTRTSGGVPVVWARLMAAVSWGGFHRVTGSRSTRSSRRRAGQSLRVPAVSTAAPAPMAADVGWAEMRVSGARGGSLTQPQDGIGLFAAALLFAWGLSVVVAVFVLRHSVDERRLVAAKARAAGHPEPATPLDHLTGFAGRAAGKAMAAAYEERARKDRAATR